MKNFKKLIFLIMTAAMFVLAAVGFVACGDDDGNGNADLSKYAGTYKIERIERQQGLLDNTYNVGDSLKPALSTLPNEYGQDTLTDDYLVIVLNADGTATVNSKISDSLGGFQGEKTGTWTINEQEIVELKALSDNMAQGVQTSLSFVNGKLRLWCQLAAANYVNYYLAK